MQDINNIKGDIKTTPLHTVNNTVWTQYGMIQRGTNHERYINVGYNLNHPATSSNEVSCTIGAILAENHTDQTKLLEIESEGETLSAYQVLPAINKIEGLKFGTNI